MKEEVLESNVRRFKWGVIIIAAVITVAISWSFFFSVESCDSWSCFNANLKSCDPATFIGGDSMIFEYEIFGPSSDRCVVNVKLLQGDLTASESRKLEGNEMVCSIPLDVVMLPESDLRYCHGVLKENLQDIIIQRLHNYIAQNLGRINLELLNAPSFGNNSLS